MSHVEDWLDREEYLARIEREGVQRHRRIMRNLYGLFLIVLIGLLALAAMSIK